MIFEIHKISFDISKIGCIFGCRFNDCSMNIKRNIIFTLEKRRKAGVIVAENVPIRMRVIYNCKRVEFTIESMR